MDATEMLPAVSPTVDWVRLPQRFPVRIEVEPNPAMPLRIGQTVSVTMIADLSAENRRVARNADLPRNRP